MRERRVLVVDDNQEMARTLGDFLTDEGYACELARGGESALALLQRGSFDVVISDVRMDGMSGMELLDRIKREDPSLPVIIMTAFGAIDAAVDAIKRGAAQYVTKPFNLEEVQVFIERVLEERDLRDEVRSLRRARGAELHGFIGASGAMRELRDAIDRVAAAASPVLITGESGTGKELVARALHAGGPRRERPFVAVNASAIPEQLLESELFGHVRGAFTGATQAHRGLFAEADGGTLFLDEIGDMPLGLQAKLLRVVQLGEVRPVGGEGARTVDVRVVAATHRDLPALAREGRFREDLYFRLNVIPLRVPALRERPEDIPALAAHFLSRLKERTPSSPVTELSAETLKVLERAPWPGNIRELENTVERLVVLGREAVITPAQLRQLAGVQDHVAGPLAEAQHELWTLRRLNEAYVAWVLDHTEGNKPRAAEILGVDLSTLYRWERQAR